MKLGYQGGQINQVSHSKVRPSGRYDKERVFVFHARPARWQRRNVTEAVAVEEQVVTPLNPPFDEVDRLAEQRMKRVSDADRCSRLSGAACSWSVGRTLGASIRPTNNCAAAADGAVSRDIALQRAFYSMMALHTRNADGYWLPRRDGRLACMSWKRARIGTSPLSKPMRLLKSTAIRIDVEIGSPASALFTRIKTGLPAT